MLLCLSVGALSSISDWPSAKVLRFGRQFVECIADFCDANRLPTNCSSAPVIPAELEPKLMELRNSARLTYETHVASAVGLVRYSRFILLLNLVVVGQSH